MGLNTTPRTWTDTEKVTATMLNTEVRDAIKGIQEAWTSYTPTWGGTSLTVGNGTATGAYTRTGKTVTFLSTLTIGSTTVFGTSLTVSLPAVHAHNGLVPLITANAYDASTLNRYLLTAEVASFGAIVRTIGTNGLQANPTATSPFTWAAGDMVSVMGTYEAS